MIPGGGGRRLPIPISEGSELPSLFLPEAVVAETERLLQTYGEGDDQEGIVYLGGLELPDRTVALSALSPKARTTWGSFRTDVEANTDVVRALIGLGLSLVGQVHSHPGDWVDHSDGDDEGALVRFRGYWSVVVPSFSKNGMRPLRRCGVHVFLDGCFRRLTETAIERSVRVIPSSVDLRGGRK
jgi:hypothetical protein